MLALKCVLNWGQWHLGGGVHTIIPPINNIKYNLALSSGTIEKVWW